MPTKVWKLFLAALVLTFAIVASPRNAEAVYGDPYCPYESWGCPNELHECCCMKGVICVSSEWQCNQFCGY